VEFLFHLCAGIGDPFEKLFVFWQEFFDLTGAFVGGVRVFEVEVVVAGFDVLDADAPGLLGFLALGVAPVFVRLAPPFFLGLELFDVDGFALIVALGALGIGVLVIPDTWKHFIITAFEFAILIVTIKGIIQKHAKILRETLILKVRIGRALVDPYFNLISNLMLF
jgi:hypothetical protein